jgi:hypothetical protein
MQDAQSNLSELTTQLKSKTKSLSAPKTFKTRMTLPYSDNDGKWDVEFPPK